MHGLYDRISGGCSTQIIKSKNGHIHQIYWTWRYMFSISRSTSAGIKICILEIVLWYGEAPTPYFCTIPSALTAAHIAHVEYGQATTKKWSLCQRAKDCSFTDDHLRHTPKTACFYRQVKETLLLSIANFSLFNKCNRGEMFYSSAL